MKITRAQARLRRHRRVRQIVSGTPERPRICVFRSNRHVSAQLIDDTTGKTLASVTTVAKAGGGKNHRNCEAATAQGVALGEKMKALDITKVVFDRSGCLYHGVIKAFADGVRSVDKEKHFNF